MRLSIEITPEQHQCFKAAAALKGKTIKAYVLERAFADIAPQQKDAQFELEALLASRIESAEQGKVSSKSVSDIMTETLGEQQN